MVNYTEVKIQLKPGSERDLLIAALAEEGFEGFEESEEMLLAFIPETDFNPESLEALVKAVPAEYTVGTIRQQNWNALWEANFDPVQVGTFCHIRAQFHPPAEGVEHEIVITPKMSFGTGHHATTYLMIETMQELDLAGKTVLDFGTGTGVLAILAEKRGADSVDAIDLDEWSIVNARENFCINQAKNIHLHQADCISLQQVYDIILANINRNVILENLSSMRSHVAADGVVLLSGLLTSDCNEVVEAAAAAGFTLTGLQERGGWIALKLAVRQY
ncbi:MAG: 50S ribosomal protein L11 methyltransferase [Williamsia sp.]|nr:50S ribosomal protein L11 methyltransferase [Williamsia sp.]